MTIEFKHVPVLYEECMENLNIRPDGIYVDGTLGGGGHAYEVCKRLGDGGRFIGIEQDADAIKAASERLKEFSDKVNAMSYVKQRKMRPLFAYASKCELDNQGRTLIPAHLREYANLTKNVTVVGCNNHAELWDENAWAKVHEAEISPENIASVMEELEF